MIEIERFGTASGPPGCQLLSTLHAACFDPYWGEAEIGQLLAAPGTLALVVTCPAADEVGAQPAGMAICRSSGAETEILTLCVVPDCRRSGMGGRLVRECSLMADHAGAGQLFLQVAADNVAALALCRGHGFQQMGRRAHYYEQPNNEGVTRDALIMRLDLWPSPPGR